MGEDKRAPSAADLAAADISGWNGRPQRRANPRKNGFNAAKRQRFLDGLALSCNIKLAAAHAGISPMTAYVARQRDPVFERQWREALLTGLERLEMLVVEHGGAGLPLEPADPDRAEAEGLAPPPFDFAKAMHVLQLYGSWRRGERGRVQPCAHQASEADTDAAIEDLLRRMRRVDRERPPARLPAPVAPEEA